MSDDQNHVWNEDNAFNVEPHTNGGYILVIEGGKILSIKPIDHTHADLIAKADELAKASKAMSDAIDSCVDLTPEILRRVSAALSAYTQVREGK